MIPNTEVLKRAQTTSIEAYLIKAQLRWTGHVLRMKDGRLSKDLLYGELKGRGAHVPSEDRESVSRTLSK